MSGSSNSRPLRALTTLGVVIALVFAAQLLRARLGIDWSADSIQTAVQGFGLWAPLGFLTLVSFRQLLALPSIVILTAAGLMFGAPLGAALGGLGIVMNACLLFGVARLMGRDWVLPRLEERYPNADQRARAAGPALIAVMTGHPMGFMTPFHFAAGATGITWLAFVLAVGLSAPVRAACYSFLGANLLDPGSGQFWLATLLLVGVALAPLAHPRVRRRVFSRVLQPRVPSQ